MEGTGHLWGDKIDEMAATMCEWATTAAGPVETERFLATIMFVDTVRSTERVAAIGDARSTPHTGTQGRSGPTATVV